MSAVAKSETGELVCPECQQQGKRNVFSRPQALGVHRSKVHGVQGGSRARARGRTGGPQLVVTKPPTPKRRKVRRVKAKRPQRLDESRLLETVFPNGIPANTKAVDRTVAWLEEARRMFTAK